MFTDYEINFSGEVAYAYPYLKPIIVKFPNPFKGLEGYASGQTFKELKKYLYVFNGTIFFQKLEEPKEVEFLELPKEGWIKFLRRKR